MDFDPVQHGLEEGFEYLNILVDNSDPIDPDAESARDNLGNALTAYKGNHGSKAHIVISGNLTEGFTVYGPYKDFEAAAEASDGAEVWITRLFSPAQAEFDL